MQRFLDDKWLSILFEVLGVVLVGTWIWDESTLAGRIFLCGNVIVGAAIVGRMIVLWVGNRRKKDKEPEEVKPTGLVAAGVSLLVWLLCLAIFSNPDRAAVRWSIYGLIALVVLSVLAYLLFLRKRKVEQ